jgi:DNA-directed RNA polymerase
VGMQDRHDMERLSMSAPDETDMTLEDLKARWAQAEPVEIVEGPVTIAPSPWLQMSRTGGRYVGRAPVVRHQSTASYLHLAGAASS